MLLRFVEFFDEKRPCGAGAVHLVEHGRTGSEHPVSVAWTRCAVECGLDRLASESVPRGWAVRPTSFDQGRAIRNHAVKAVRDAVEGTHPAYLATWTRFAQDLRNLALASPQVNRHQ